MSLKVDDFKARLIGGGARPNLFRCIINNPPGIGANIPVELASFMCKGGSHPSSTVASIDVPFRGRQLKLPGDRTFENWTATIYNDGAFAVRNAFERWMNGINGHQTGLAESLNPIDYMAQIEVSQLNRQGFSDKRYIIEGAFPINVSSIDLAFESNDQIEEFTVEFAYQYWLSDTTDKEVEIGFRDNPRVSGPAAEAAAAAPAQPPSLIGRIGGFYGIGR